MEKLPDLLMLAFERAKRLCENEAWPEDLRVWDIVRLIRERPSEGD